MSRPDRAAYRDTMSSTVQEAGFDAQPGRQEVTLQRKGVVDRQQSDIGQRVAEGGHLPVDDGGDAAEVRAVDDVGQPVVAVHDAGSGLPGNPVR